MTPLDRPEPPEGYDPLSAETLYPLQELMGFEATG